MNDRFPTLTRLLLSQSLRGALALVLVLGLVAAMAPGSAKAAEKVNTRLEFDVFGLIYADGTYDYVFAGLVTTPLRGFPCMSRREVHVYRVVPGAPDERIGSRRSDLFGFAPVMWRDPDLAEVPGSYYARVEKARRKTRGRRLRCSADRSATITVSEPQFHRASASAADEAQARFARAER